MYSTYVEQGVADLGIIDEDVIVPEQSKDVIWEQVDLGYGYCGSW